jgi:hypothetical protein
VLSIEAVMISQAWKSYVALSMLAIAPEPALLGLLTVASLIAPAILAYQVSRHQVTDGVAIVIGSMALFLLVVTRTAQLLRQIERQSRQLGELAPGALPGRGCRPRPHPGREPAGAQQRATDRRSHGTRRELTLPLP